VATARKVPGADGWRTPKARSRDAIHDRNPRSAVISFGADADGLAEAGAGSFGRAPT